MRAVFWMLLMLWLAAGWFPTRGMTAEQMQGLLKNRPEIDEIRWKDPARGGMVKVRIVRISGGSVLVEKLLPAGMMARTVALDELSGLKISFTAAELALLRKPDAGAVAPLRVLWESRRGGLRFAGSGIGEIGLALAKALRLSGEAAALGEAVSVVDEVISLEPVEAEKARARAERVTIDFVRSMRSAAVEQTDLLAWKITEDSRNADAMLLATGYLADRHFKVLKALEEENPRWVEDDEVRPVRERLYHLALDFSLYPGLFAGTRKEEAAAGMKRAAEVYQFAKQADLLRGVLEDLAALYPESPEAKETAGLLAKLKQAEAAGKTLEIGAKEEGEDSAEKGGDEAVPGLPPLPKRYNIFGD